MIEFKQETRAILKNQDCMDLMKEIPDGFVDLIVTDPPYEICTRGAGIYNQPDKQYVKRLNSMRDGYEDSVLDEMCRVMRKINIYLWCAQKQIIHLLDYFVSKRKCNWNILSWHKTNPVPACGNKYLTDTEFILYFREKGVPIFGSYETKKTWYASPIGVKEKKLYNHPTVKPTNILKNLIINSSEEGEIVFDPFMGTGSTGVACIETGRRFIGCEIEKPYFETALDRICSAKAVTEAIKICETEEGEESGNDSIHSVLDCGSHYDFDVL